MIQNNNIKRNNSDGGFLMIETRDLFIKLKTYIVTCRGEPDIYWDIGNGVIWPHGSSYSLIFLLNHIRYCHTTEILSKILSHHKDIVTPQSPTPSHKQILIVIKPDWSHEQRFWERNRVDKWRWMFWILFGLTAFVRMEKVNPCHWKMS